MPQIETPFGMIELPYGDEQPQSGIGAPPQAGMGAAPESPTAILEQILSLADTYRQQEQSQQNLLLVERLRTIAQQILAAEEKEQDGMLQGKLSPQAVRRFAGGP